MAGEKKNLFNPKLYATRRGKVPGYVEQTVSLVMDVGFSKEMNSQQMTRSVAVLQQSIYEVLAAGYYWNEKDEFADLSDVILIPVGNGYGLSLNNLKEDHEILSIASELWKKLSSENLSIRMGIAKGCNVITVDLNGKVNIFGYGIALATRVCAAAREGQILVESGLAGELNQNKIIPELTKIPSEFVGCHNYYRKGEFGISLLKEYAKQ
jgi:hypothetical protein